MKLVVKVYATSEYGDSPCFAIVDVTSELVAHLKHLSSVCTDNGLSQVQTFNGPDEWDLQDDLLLRGDALHVDDDCFYYSAFPKYGDYRVETLTINIVWLKELLDKGEHPYFKVIDGIAYYPDSEADDLRDLAQGVSEDGQ